MLQERERKKKAEYQAREDVDTAAIGMDHGELAQLKELDYMYGGETTERELEEMEEEEERAYNDPYMQ